MLRTPILRLAVAALVLMACQWGCGGNTPGPRRGGSGGGDRSGALLQGVAAQLAQLPELSIVELTPEVPILDARSSEDGRDVIARLEPTSAGGAAFYNRLVVPAGNARFRALGIRPGDIVRYYARLQSELGSEYRSGGPRYTQRDRESLSHLTPEQQTELLEAEERERINEGDILITQDIKIEIAQVIDSNTLLLAEPLNNMILEGTIDANATAQGVRLEIWRTTDQRMGELVLALNRYARDGVPRLGWEPSPDQSSLQQIVEHLNQWLLQSKFEVEWNPAKLRESLPSALLNEPKLAPFVSDEALERNAFSQFTPELRAVQAVPYEGRLLQEATWARDISQWATAHESKQERRVVALFDWVVRNLQYDDRKQQEDGESVDPPAYRPWQMILSGRADAQGRAWVFAQLCRQIHVPVVMLRPSSSPVVETADGENAGAADQDWLLCGAVVGEQIYLFDPYLGLAIPGKEGLPATLRELRDDPAPLRTLDLPNQPYGVGDSALERVDALVVAEPFVLTRRAALLESRLTGDHALVLSVHADRLAEQLGKQGLFEKVVLWSHPYEILLAQINQPPRQRAIAALEFEPFCYRPHLWRARMLHFRGRRGTQQDSLASYSADDDDHLKAGSEYTRPNVRPTYRQIQQQQSAEVQRAWAAAKINATYWTGLLKYDQREYQIASVWFKRSQEIEGNKLKWYPGARYNQSRTLEALGETEEAIAILEADDPELPPGAKQRARLLQTQKSAADTVPAAASQQ